MTVCLVCNVADFRLFLFLHRGNWKSDTIWRTTEAGMEEEDREV